MIVKRLTKNMFKTSFIEIVRLCQSVLNFELPRVRQYEGKHVAKFEQKLLNSEELIL